jgi:hypothetical protein
VGFSRVKGEEEEGLIVLAVDQRDVEEMMREEKLVDEREGEEFAVTRVGMSELRKSGILGWRFQLGREM